MRRIEIFSITLALLAFMSGCSSVASQSAPKGAPHAATLTSFDGRWRLDAAASDDVRARLIPLFERDDKYWRRAVERLEDGGPRFEEKAPPGGDDGISHGQWLQRERAKEVQSLIALLSPATQIDITHSDRSIRFASDKGEGTRVFTPGEESHLFLSLGGFEVTSAWDKGGLLVKSRGTGENKLSITELFTLRGDALEERLDVKIPGIAKQSFHALYRR